MAIKKPKETNPISALLKLNWIDTVVPYKSSSMNTSGYEITTKKGKLTTTLTHKIRLASKLEAPSFEGKYMRGSELKKPIEVDLPEYRIVLMKPLFVVALLNKPTKTNEQRIKHYPTYTSPSNKNNWRTSSIPCLSGGTREDYQKAKTWVERAIIAAIYLQSAEPHYGQTWYRTSFAYRLGLVGKALLEKKK